MCEPGCVCDACWSHFFQVRFPELVAGVVMESFTLATAAPPQVKPHERAHQATKRTPRPHPIPKVRAKRRPRRAPDRDVVDVESPAVEEPVGVLPPEPPAAESSPRTKEAVDEGSRDLRTITKEEAAEMERTQPVVQVKVPFPRMWASDLDARPPKPTPPPPKKTVKREKALKEIRLEQMRKLRAARKPKEIDPEEEAPKSLEDEDMEALQFDSDIGSEDAIKLNAGQID